VRTGIVLLTSFQVSSFHAPTANARANILIVVLEIGQESSSEEDGDHAPQQPTNLQRKLFDTLIGEYHVLILCQLFSKSVRSRRVRERETPAR
jgi:hypothetical protein